MEKEMLALVNLKEGKLETFMGWITSCFYISRYICLCKLYTTSTCRKRV